MGKDQRREEEEGDDAEKSWRRAGIETERELGGKKKEEEEGVEKESREKKNPKKQTGQNTPKFTEMAETHRNTSKFYPRWNGGLSRTGLHTGTRFSIRSDQNGTEYTTMVITIISISLACSYLVNLYIHWQMPIEFVSVENEEKNTVIFFIYYF